jgi:hypothetical protein
LMAKSGLMKLAIGNIDKEQRKSVLLKCSSYIKE